MKTLKKIFSLLRFKKPEPWYKRWLKKAAFMLDMKRRNKIITFFALLLVAGYLCLPSMEGMVRRMVQKYGSELTGTTVDFKHLKLKPTSGEGSVRNISIGNPQNYQSKNLFTLDDLSVKVDISSLTDDTIVIEQIRIDRPVLTYEMLSLTQNNISDVLSRVQARTKADTSSTQKAKDQSADTSKKVIVKNLTVTNGTINIVAGIGTLKQPIPLPLPEITMKNIGKAQGGASTEETLSAVLENILTTATKAVAASGVNQIGETIEDSAKVATDSVKNVGQKAANGFKSLFK
jgi:hypothetical protein